MEIDSIRFKGHRCFKNEWVGFDVIKPINVIIGRNNTGKSHLLDLVEVCCSGKLAESKWLFRCTGALTSGKELEACFPPNTSGGDLPGSHWHHHGRHFHNQKIQWETNTHGGVDAIQTISSNLLSEGEKHYDAYSSRISRIAANAQHSLYRRIYKRLLADRDIEPDGGDERLSLNSDGRGATNIVRRFLTSSDSVNIPREVIQQQVLNGLNQIFANDGQFNEIAIQHHDHRGASRQGNWEIYLGEKGKGIVPLSNSGSGLKTVLLVLLNLIVVPVIEKKEEKEFVFAFEELENNLHPALLRRLFQYIEDYAKTHGAVFFLTTHSNVALDFFGVSDLAQIIHVTHDGISACASTVSAYFDKVGIISELGAKPSDLLQANGIIWVEGPSDRVYLNKWIALCSNGELQEGRDYQCAFFGGALLAREEFTTPEDEQADKNRANLLHVNPNVILVCDGDRPSDKAKIKDRVRRISQELRRNPRALFWATKGREIENYVPGTVMEKALGRANIPDPTQYIHFFPRVAERSKSFIEDKLNRKTLDKTQFAVDCTKYMTTGNMEGRFDWSDQMPKIVKKIREWNEK